eukprot:1162142-Pelagomonas_calceolata.AAC.15
MDQKQEQQLKHGGSHTGKASTQNRAASADPSDLLARADPGWVPHGEAAAAAHTIPVCDNENSVPVDGCYTGRQPQTHTIPVCDYEKSVPGWVLHGKAAARPCHSHV